MKIAVLSIVLLFLLPACKKTEPAEIEIGYSYFPLTDRSYRIYQVDSIVINDFTSSIDSFSYQIKERINGLADPDKNNGPVRIERYYRKHESDSWTLSDVWTALMDNRHALVYEENIPSVKLSFPMRVKDTWNRNLYNTLGEKSSTMQAWPEAYFRGDYALSQTASVLLEADSNLIRKVYQTERYAPGIGMIEKKQILLEDRDSIIDVAKKLEQRADFGYYLQYTLLLNGLE